jgi:hypothetical protein
MKTRQAVIHDEEAERRALKASIGESDMDPRVVPHEQVRAWLQRLADGDFDAPVPEPN